MAFGQTDDLSITVKKGQKTIFIILPENMLMLHINIIIIGHNFLTLSKSFQLKDQDSFINLPYLHINS